MPETAFSSVARLSLLRGVGDATAWSVRHPEASEEAPTVFALHGLTSRKERMLELCLRLADAGFHAVAPDAPYHGDRREGIVSAVLEDRGHPEFLPTFARTIRQYAAEVGEWAQALGIGRFAAVGHSMGGFVAFHAARLWPELFGVVALNGTLLPTYFSAPDVHRDAFEDLAPTADLAALSGRAVAMLHGVDDPAVPIGASRELHQRLLPRFVGDPERLSLIEYPGVGHGLVSVMLEDAVAFLRRNR